MRPALTSGRSIDEPMPSRCCRRTSSEMSSRSSIRPMGTRCASSTTSPTPRRCASSTGRRPYRAEHGLGDKQVVMYSGNVGLSQSFDLVRAAADRFADRLDVHFVINGEGAARPSVDEWAAERPNVTVSDFAPREAVSDVLGAADLHLILLKRGLAQSSTPSKMYGILAAARPVLASIDEGSEVELTIDAAGAGRAVPPRTKRLSWRRSTKCWPIRLRSGRWGAAGAPILPSRTAPQRRRPRSTTCSPNSPDPEHDDRPVPRVRRRPRRWVRRTILAGQYCSQTEAAAVAARRSHDARDGRRPTRRTDSGRTGARAHERRPGRRHPVGDAGAPGRQRHRRADASRHRGRSGTGCCGGEGPRPRWCVLHRHRRPRDGRSRPIPTRRCPPAWNWHRSKTS